VELPNIGLQPTAARAIMRPPRLKPRVMRTSAGIDDNCDDLKSSDARTRERGLAKLPSNPTSARIVVRLLQDEDRFVRNAALEWIRGRANNNYLQAVLPSLRDRFAVARVSALECVASWARPRTGGSSSLFWLIRRRWFAPTRVGRLVNWAAMVCRPCSEPNWSSKVINSLARRFMRFSSGLRDAIVT
jgi:hypothetical protein